MKILPRFTLNPTSATNHQTIIDELLKQRSISQNDFITTKLPGDYSLEEYVDKKQLTKAIQLIKKHMDYGNTIVVYTDYDADGITGGTILWEALHKIKAKVMPFVPHRTRDGYGFSISGIDTMIEQLNPQLVISVDHGITAIEQVKYLKKRGIDVIITDHHQKQEKVPDAADFIFHVPALSGAGVAYYFAKAVVESIAPESKRLQHLFENDYSAIAAIGAVADLVPLTGATRSLVKHGLTKFQTIKRIGLRQLMEESKINDRVLTPYDIGFVIAPRINAIGRLDHALDALRLLCTNKPEKAIELTHKLAETNTQRRSLVDKAIKQAKEMVADMKEIPRVIIVRNDEWHEGIIGLIASKLSEQYYRPVVILTKSEHVLKASARSPVTVNLMNLLGTWKSQFVNFGGHHQAAGFSIEETKYDSFLTTAITSCNELIPEDSLERFLEPDIEMPITYASQRLAETLETFEPFGVGNPRPIFYSSGKVVEVKRMGKDKKHLKLWVRDPETRSIPIELVAFSRGEDATELIKKDTIHTAYNLELNRWNGKVQVQGKLIHWH